MPEFAVASIQAEIGESGWYAQQLVADTMSLVYRLPRIFSVLHDGAVSVERARMVASATRDLSLDAVAQVQDHLMVGRPQHSPLVTQITRRRLVELIDQVVIKDDPDDAEDQVARALADRDVTFRPGLPGTCDVRATVASADGARLRQRLEQIVGWLVEAGDDRTRHVLRAVALGMLADPGTIDQLYSQVQRIRAGQQMLDDDPAADPADAEVDEVRPVPATVLYVHHDPGTGTWSMDGAGPITTAEAHDLVGHSHVVVKPVIDLAADLTFTGYVAPPRLKEQLSLLNAGRCTFPHCDRPAKHGDYDHIEQYPRGPTSSRNGQLLCRTHHRAKTHTRWPVSSPATEVWIWEDPDRRVYLVTAGTTTCIT